MPKKGWISLFGFLAMIFAIAYGGPRLSAYTARKEREKIDKNGRVVRALVYSKNTHKGNSTLFRYEYKNRLYKNREQGNPIFDTVNIGDSITILIDSTRPSNSYILAY